MTNISVEISRRIKKVKKVAKADVKYNITLRGIPKDFILDFALRHFEDNVSGAIRYCIDYVMKRENQYTKYLNKYGVDNRLDRSVTDRYNGYLCSRWVDLPKSRIRDIDKDMNDRRVFMYNGNLEHSMLLDEYKVTVYLMNDQVEYLDAYINEKGSRMSREITRNDMGHIKVIKESAPMVCQRYPQLGGMRRNAILQCVYMLMYDISIMCMNGQAMTSVESLERYYKL